MNKKIGFIFAVATGLLLANFAYAQTAVPVVPPRVVDSASGCTGFETTSNCRPEWTKAQESCIPNTYSSISNSCSYNSPNGFIDVLRVCGPTYNDGPCRPERINKYASAGVAKQAEIMGNSIGYNTVCKVEELGLAGVPDPTTGLKYFYNIICSINGSPYQFGAELLVNNPNNWLLNEIKNAGGTTGTGTGSSTGTTGGSTTTGTTGGTTSVSTAYAVNLIHTISAIIANLKSTLASIGTSQPITTTPTQTIPITNTSTPLVSLALSNGSKIGTFSVGDAIGYKVLLDNVNSVASYYNTIPKDSCTGGSLSGEQKPWVINTVRPVTDITDFVKSCQAGSTYVITVVGTNTTTGAIAASSISIYIRP